MRLIADAVGVDRFAVLGASGGGPHALAGAAALPQRVLATIVLAGLAPFGADGLDWFAGMVRGGASELRAAVEGRAALESCLASSEFDESSFIAADYAALAGAWSQLGTGAAAGLAGGPGGMVDDDLAYVTPWGFDPAHISGPILLVHGGSDRVVPCAHGEWLERHCPSAELWLRPDDGHISILTECPAALDWLIERVADRTGG